MSEIGKCPHFNVNQLFTGPDDDQRSAALDFLGAARALLVTAGEAVCNGSVQGLLAAAFRIKLRSAPGLARLA
jgi:hypothetical protein